MRYLHNVLAAIAFVVGLSIASHSSAQLTNDQLDAALPGILINDPSRIDWDSYGSELEASAIVDEKIPGGGAARRFVIRKAKEHIYTAGTNIPLVKRAKRGDDITVGFYARTIDARTDDGNGVLRIRFQKNMEPYPGFGEKTLSIGKDWEWYEVTAKAEMALRTKDGIVAIQFGRTKQTLEIGQAIVVTGASAIADNSIPLPTVSKTILAKTKNELPKPLAGTGALLNLPAQRDWILGGTGGDWQKREEPQIWLGQATRFNSKKVGASATELYAKIPLARALEKGDELIVAIAARTENAVTEDGKAVVAVRIEDTTLSSKNFAANRFKVGPNWQLIRIKTRVPSAFTAGSAQIGLFFAGAKQIVDIGPVYLIKTNR